MKMARIVIVWHIKIADFGSVKPTRNTPIKVLPNSTNETAWTFVGTTAYVPPEGLSLVQTYFRLWRPTRHGNKIPAFSKSSFLYIRLWRPSRHENNIPAFSKSSFLYI